MLVRLWEDWDAPFVAELAVPRHTAAMPRTVEPRTSAVPFSSEPPAKAKRRCTDLAPEAHQLPTIVVGFTGALDVKSQTQRNSSSRLNACKIL